jgi:hypothetical protein
MVSRLLASSHASAGSAPRSYLWLSLDGLAKLINRIHTNERAGDQNPVGSAQAECWYARLQDVRWRARVTAGVGDTGNGAARPRQPFDEVGGDRITASD